MKASVANNDLNITAFCDNCGILYVKLLEEFNFNAK